jgi:hypothetical protein
MPDRQDRQGEARAILLRCASDPAYLTRLRAGYSGERELLDVLAWRADPLVGENDPARGLAELKRAAFSRDSSDVDRRRSQERMLALERSLAEDSAALDSALAAAEPVTVPVAAPPPASDPLAPEVHPEPSPEALALRRLVAFFRRPVGTALLVVVVLVLVVGGGLTEKRQYFDVGYGLDIFARERVVRDALPSGYNEVQIYDAQTSRRMPSQDGWEIWAAHKIGQPDTVCLMIERLANGSAQCTTTADFLKRGLTLEFRSVVGYPVVDIDGTTMPIGSTVTFHWKMHALVAMAVKYPGG